MSGPKSGGISIEAMRRARLRAQRELNDRICKDALAAARAKAVQVEGVIAGLDGWGSPFARRLKELRERCEHDLVSITITGFPEDPAQAEAFNAGLPSRVGGRLSSFESELGRLRAQASGLGEVITTEQARRDELLRLGEAVAPQASSRPQTALLGGVDAIRARLGKLMESSPAASPASGVLGEASRRCEEICQLIASDAVLDPGYRETLMRHVEELRRAIEDYAANPARYAAIESALRVGEDILPAIRREARVAADLYDECKAFEARCEAMSGRSMALLPLGSFASLSELSRVRDELEQAAERASEEAYIAYAVDTVMRRHGYHVKRTVCLSGVSRVGHSVYAAPETKGEMGIHLGMSPDGAFMMETVALDDSVIEGDDGQMIERLAPSDAYERMRSVAEQREFCTLFEQMDSELAQMGVIVDKRFDKPVSEDNASILASVDRQGAMSGQQARRRAARREGEVLREREMK